MRMNAVLNGSGDHRAGFLLGVLLEWIAHSGGRFERELCSPRDSLSMCDIFHLPGISRVGSSREPE